MRHLLKYQNIYDYMTTNILLLFIYMNMLEVFQ